MSSILRQLILEDSGNIEVSLNEFDITNDYIDLMEREFELEQIETSVEHFDLAIEALGKIIDIDNEIPTAALEKYTDIFAMGLGLEANDFPIKMSDAGGQSGTKPEEKKEGFLKKTWEKIKRVLKVISDKMVQLYKTIFDSAYKVSKNADKTMEAIKAAEKANATSEKKDIEFNFSRLLAKNQKLPDFTGNLENLSKELIAFSSGKGVADIAKKRIKFNNGENFMQIAATYSSLIDFSIEYTSLMQTKGDSTIPKSMSESSRGKTLSAKKSGILPGNKALYCYEEGTPVITDIKYKIGPYADDNNAGKMSMDVLSLKDLSAGIDYINKLMKLVTDYKKAEPEIKKIREEIKTAGNNFAKNVSKVDFNEGGGKLNALGYLFGIRWVGQTIDRPANYINALTVNICKNWLSLIQDMLKTYKTKK